VDGELVGHHLHREVRDGRVRLVQLLQHRDQGAPLAPELRDQPPDLVVQSLLLPY
jgi:hypothetical protein